MNTAIDELSNARMLADNQLEIVTQDESPRDRSGSVKREFIRLSRGFFSYSRENLYRRCLNAQGIIIINRSLFPRIEKFRLKRGKDRRKEAKA